MALFEGATEAFGLVGDTPEIHRVLRFLRKLENSRLPVLLEGESGTGKELVARALHEVSPGAKGVYVAVNTATLTPTLAESELFGHARGSFTGAAASRRGLFEQAAGGTLFLDEIGEFPLEMQAKLLRVLEQNEIRPVGADRAITVDTRVIAASNRDLAREVEAGRFRRDLYHRLNVVKLRLAPLRERRADIPLLVRRFLADVPRPIRLTREAIEWLAAYDWPGNVRELENCVRRMAALASGSEAHVDALPTEIRNAVEAARAAPARNVTPPPEDRPLADVERRAILEVMQAVGGDRQKAAKILNIGRSTLYRKLIEYGWAGKTGVRSQKSEVRSRAAAGGSG